MSASYLTNLTEKYVNTPDPKYIGRDDLIKLLFLTMLRNEKPNALLTGEPGVGKTSLVHYMAYLIANDLCPDMFKGYKVLEINTNNLLAGPGYRGVTEDKFASVIQSAVDLKNVIIFFDEFHTVENLGKLSNDSTPGLGNALKPFLTRPDIRVIGSTTVDEFRSIKDKALLRRFFRINISEPPKPAVLKIIESCLSEYGAGLRIQKSVIPHIYNITKSLDGFFPDKAKDVCDFLCSFCQMDKIKNVNIAVVDEFFINVYQKSISNHDFINRKEKGTFVD